MSAYKMGLSIGSSQLAKTSDFFMELKENGIQWSEISMAFTPYDDPRHTQLLAQRLLNEGMKLWSIHVPFGAPFDIASPDEAVRTHAVELICPFLTVAKELGVGRAVVHPSWEPIADDARAAHIAAFKRSLPALCDAAEAAGVTLCIENIPRSCLAHTSSEMLDMLSADARARICLDTNHMLLEEAHVFAKAVADKVVTLHISDYDMTNEKHWLPGEGIADFRQLFAALREAGYDGVYMMELGTHRDGTPYTPKEAADALKALL